MQSMKLDFNQDIRNLGKENNRYEQSEVTTDLDNTDLMRGS